MFIVQVCIIKLHLFHSLIHCNIITHRKDLVLANILTLTSKIIYNRLAALNEKAIFTDLLFT